MQSIARLIKVCAVNAEVSNTVTWLMNHDGLCACGRWLAASDAKFILTNIGPHDSPDPMRRDVAVVAAYCFSCFTIINAAMKSVVNSAYKEKRSEAELRG